MYEILVERRAERDLKGLPAQDFRRIVVAIQALAENPRPPGCRKITGSKSVWRIKVGPYRVVYEIDERSNAIRIMRVRHRRDVYQ